MSQTTAQLDWTEPICEEKNGVITGYEYEVEAMDDWVRNKQKSGSQPNAQLELTGLVPYTRYRFRVRAVNSKGSGPMSEFIEFRTKSGRKLEQRLYTVHAFTCILCF